MYIMKVIPGSSENHKVHYNPSIVPKPPEELQIIILPFIYQLRNSLNALGVYDLRPTYFDLLDLVEKGRTIFLQDFTQLIHIGRNHILFDHAVFKTELFLKYK